MNLRTYISIPLLLFTLCVCGKGSDISAGGYVPVEPDYDNPEMWVRYANDYSGTGADVFYIPSTWEFDWTTSGGSMSHYADPSLEKHRADMKIEMDRVAGYLADSNNFFSPFYRHITLNTWATLDEDLIDSRYFLVSFVDVKNAYTYFQEHRDSERPFILAGFSQGGKSVVELLKLIPEEDRDKLVAAYVMGYKVTPDDMSVAPWIRGALGEEDTGVVICYNSVSDISAVKPIVCEHNVLCINPVNWRTDAEPAILNDTVTVTLSPEYKVLVVEGYDGSHLHNILGILNVGDYHGAEPYLYSENLRENMKRRIASWHNR